MKKSILCILNNIALRTAVISLSNKIAVAGIQPLAVRRLFNGLDTLQFTAVNCNQTDPHSGIGSKYLWQSGEYHVII